MADDGTNARLGFFDRFAGGASDIASLAPFFVFCLGLVGFTMALAARSWST